MTAFDKTTTYHEIDFLLEAQRFNINFSYISKKQLPFYREFVLRLVHLAPLSTSQIATFFDFSRLEVQEVIDDLIERNELTLSERNQLTLTEKSNSYFTEFGEIPLLSQLQDSTGLLWFDLATFSCLGKDNLKKVNSGFLLKTNSMNASDSESHVQKHFQRQFHEILQKGYLSKSLTQDNRETPNIYTVNTVTKIRNGNISLPVQFKIDEYGKNIEREDFEKLNNSEYVQEQISLELNRLSRPSNFDHIKEIMLDIGDSQTVKIFNQKDNSVNLKFFEDLIKLESNDSKKRTTFLGPIYSSSNWNLIQKRLAPIIKFRRESKLEMGETPFIWIAPSDPYWGKSSNLQVSVNEVLRMSTTKEDKKIYSPVIFLPLSSSDDTRTRRQWKREFDPTNAQMLHGLIEGFLGGNVELLYFKDEFAVVIYHFSLPNSYTVSFPVGFISNDKNFVTSIGDIANEYINGSKGFQESNNCGLISQINR